MKLKKGDTIVVTIGRDKGRRGKVERVIVGAQKVVVAGINMYKRHMKKRDEKNPGGIIELVRPIDVAKVALVCPSCGKPTRVGYVMVKDEKVRICKKCKKKL
jgi:large subunit ribosomal protein L24